MRRVLVVDDEPDVLLLSRVVLEPAGYEVIEASGGHEALELAARERPDLMLLDVRMPGLDGWAVLAAVKGDGLAGLPVVMFSAHAEPDTPRRAMEAGCRAYLQKPFTPTALLDTVAAALGR